MSAVKRNFTALNTVSVYTAALSTATKKKKLAKLDSSISSTIRVYARFRMTPIGESVDDLYTLDLDENSVSLLKTPESILRNGGKNTFFFNEVFSKEASQKEVTKTTCLPLLSDLFTKKKSSLVFSYGITNAGKTYTIVGTKEDPGILPRSFAILNEVKNFINKNIGNPNAILELPEFEFAMSSVYWLNSETDLTITSANLHFESFEIYNEDIYDLIADPKDRKNSVFNRPKLQMREKDNKKYYIKDLNSIEIASQESWASLLEKSLANRTLGDNNINYRSSRSHTIFKLIMRFNYGNESTSNTQEATLCIVDLAGAERAKKTANSGIELAEAGKINQSLLILGRCIKALANTSNANTVVPYRDCKLTRILYEYFNEDCNLVMIANINPTIPDFEESLRVLDYAAQSKEILPIRSKVDSIRKNVINFPLAALNRSKIGEENSIDTTSLVSNEDTILKSFIEDKENLNPSFCSTLKNHDAKHPELVEGLQCKLMKSMQDNSEKDSKIQYLEDLIQKMQRASAAQGMAERLRKVTENSRRDALNYFACNPIQRAEPNKVTSESNEATSLMKPSLSNKPFVNFIVFNAINDAFLSNLIHSQGTSKTEPTIIPETQASQTLTSENRTTQASGEDTTLNYEADNEKQNEKEKEIDQEEKDSQKPQGKKKDILNDKKKKVERKKLTQKSPATKYVESQKSQEQESSQSMRSRSRARQAKIKRRQASTDDDYRSDNNTLSQQRGLTPIARRLRERPKKHNCLP